MRELLLLSLCVTAGISLTACGASQNNEQPSAVSEQIITETETPSFDTDTPTETVIQEPDINETMPDDTSSSDPAKGDESVLSSVYDFLASVDYTTPKGFDAKNDDTEYGELTETEYFSTTTNAVRKCFVYTPPGYDPDTAYPVMYLLHGIGGTHREWLGGTPDEIISNLIAAEEAVPMIVVIPNVRAMENDEDMSDLFGPENIAAFDNFINDLRDDLMPYISENYPVSDKREETAIAGLSMGGREALFIGVSMPETFGYIGAFCPAPGLLASEGFPGQLPADDFTLPEQYANNTFIMINAGNRDNVVGDNPLIYHNTLTDNGIQNAYYSIDGGHDFGVWKNGLYYFVRCIFQSF